MLIQFVTWGFVNEHVLFGDAYIEGSKTLVRGYWDTQTRTLATDGVTLSGGEILTMSKGFVIIYLEYKKGKLQPGQSKGIVWG